MIKDTKHHYRGYDILGTTYQTSGGYVLGGRHFVEGGVARNYNITKDGKYVINPNTIYEKLYHAKEEVDRLINSKLFELKYCEECIQMTNHIGEVCQKHTK